MPWFNPSSEYQFLSGHSLGLQVCHQTQFLSRFLMWHFAKKIQISSGHNEKIIHVVSGVLCGPGCQIHRSRTSVERIDKMLTLPMSLPFTLDVRWTTTKCVFALVLCSYDISVQANKNSTSNALFSHWHHQNTLGSTGYKSNLNIFPNWLLS